MNKLKWTMLSWYRTESTCCDQIQTEIFENQT